MKGDDQLSTLIASIAPLLSIRATEPRLCAHTRLGRKNKWPVHIKPAIIGPWDNALEQLYAWDPAWAEFCAKMTTNPWTSGVLSRKFVELVGVGLNAASTNLNPDGTRRHIALRSMRGDP